MPSNHYISEIKNRSLVRFSLGLLPRSYNSFKNICIVFISNLRGASVDYTSAIPLALAIKANKNLIVGQRCLIDSKHIDLRERIIIHNDVIINDNVKIIRQSHDYNDINFNLVGDSLEIHNWAWLASESLILPGCNSIGEGAIVAAGAVVTKSIEKMEIYAGNPAKKIKDRIQLPTNLYLPKYHGLDAKAYLKARFNKSI